MQIFQKVIYFQTESFYDVSFEGISSEFGKVVYFDMFIKFPIFHKYCFIS